MSNIRLSLRIIKWPGFCPSSQGPRQTQPLQASSAGAEPCAASANEMAPHNVFWMFLVSPWAVVTPASPKVNSGIVGPIGYLVAMMWHSGTSFSLGTGYNLHFWEFPTATSYKKRNIATIHSQILLLCVYQTREILNVVLLKLGQWLLTQAEKKQNPLFLNHLKSFF